MSGRGIVEGEIFRSELIEANARTSDPTNPAVGDWWIRSNVQPSVDGATTVGALRVQGSGGILEVPFFDAAEVSNLGSDVYVGERFRFDDGTVGFIAETDQGGSLGSPRLLAPDGTEYQAHDALELSASPDSVITRLDDNTSTSTSNNEGMVITANSEWPSIGVRFSNLTSGFTRAYLYKRDGGDVGSLIKDIDVSGLTSGDTATFNDVNLSSDTDYVISVDAEGSNYTRGYLDDASLPYTSPDVDMIADYTSGGGDKIASRGVARCFTEIGDVGFY